MSLVDTSVVMKRIVHIIQKIGTVVKTKSHILLIFLLKYVYRIFKNIIPGSLHRIHQRFCVTCLQCILIMEQYFIYNLSISFEHLTSNVLKSRRRRKPRLFNVRVCLSSSLFIATGMSKISVNL